jgi:outer membrane protein insertion porin family
VIEEKVPTRLIFAPSWLLPMILNHSSCSLPMYVLLAIATVVLQGSLQPVWSSAPSQQQAEKPTPETNTTPEQSSDPPAQQPEPPEKEVLITEVQVQGVEGELLNQVYGAISTRPGLTTTRSQIQTDINAIFATGSFSQVRAEPEDTPKGVKVTFIVQPNPVLRRVQTAGTQSLTQAEVERIFAPQYGKVLNLNELKAGIQSVNKLYQDKGYLLGQVLGSPQIDPDGTVTLQVAEGIVERVNVQYQNKEGEPAKGRTREFVITREMKTKPGEIVNKEQLQKDLQRVYNLGLFEQVEPSFTPGEDPRKVALNLTVRERRSWDISPSAGFSSREGLFGQLNFSQNNLGGNHQRVNAQAQVGTNSLQFETSFTDPWIATAPYRTSYTVSTFNRQTRPLGFDGGKTDINLGTQAIVSDPDGIPNSGDEVQGLVDSGNTPRVNRLGGSIRFSRPFTKDLDKTRTAWTASAGLRYERISILEPDQDINNFDELGNSLSFSGTGQDDLWTINLGLAKDSRNDPTSPTKGSLFQVGVDQSVPVGQGNIQMTKLQASFSQFVPVKLLNFTKGPQALAFQVKGGTVLGDLPPYEGFTIGGADSIRGFSEGGVGTGRSFLQASAEYRFPLLKLLGGIGGVLYADYGTTLGTQDAVPGNPGIVREKSGDGFGYGVGVRIKTPLGFPIRLDYGWTDQGENRIQFGVGERF